jgi:hypothetical protein
MNRNAVIVACKILSLLPSNEIAFKNDLASFIENSAYRSPELCVSSIVWIELEYVMKKYITKIDNAWKKEVVDIYTAKINIE